MRKKGHTYRQIQEKLGVSQWACITYLREIKPEKSWVDKEWMKAEEEAKEVLETQGFSNLINLNNICPSSHWDYYCEKDGKRWLIDVTISGGKNIVDKVIRSVDGFESAILFKNTDGWRMVEINMREIEIS